MIKEQKTRGLEYVYHDGEFFAILLRADYEGGAVTFFRPTACPSSSAISPIKKGTTSRPTASTAGRSFFTQEVLFMRRGRVKIHFL